MNENDSENYKLFILHKKNISIEIFPEQGRLCSIFNHFSIQFTNFPQIVFDTN